MNTLKALALAALLAAGPAAAQQADRLVNVVTAENPQTQLMSMVLTLQALQQGANVRVMLCGPAADIALKEAPESATAGQPPKDMSPQGALMAAIKAGAKAEVCAIYLPGKGATPEALIEGVTVAEPPAMAKALMHRSTRVWSF
ncbi:putative peroxiredoxin [Rhodovulum iodosum]|uniref:Peroxiredoxin n=1 Tax=Rhodovulum iodosum TaxID=68291 RepID=A0ABV3XXC2_9RHOB|nr:hypothetical protein [Rhodovulum robiginosum]RSK37838.1 hypothetical protein EJA01_04140 [Rhodovulum robiginosum]